MRIVIIFISLLSSLSYADNIEVSKQQTFSVVLSTSRIIYTPGSNGKTVSVLNEQNFPVLVQSQISMDDEASHGLSGRFTVAPPLFRLDAQQRATMRIAHTGGQFPEDRESLYWLCVKGIPPSGEEAWSEGNHTGTASVMVQATIKNCIKLLVRPQGLAGQNALAMAEQLSWRLDSRGLTAVNPTPFYINLSTLTVGGKAVEQVRHIAPFASRTFALPTGMRGEVQWRALNDLGGEGPLLHAAIQ